PLARLPLLGGPVPVHGRREAVVPVAQSAGGAVAVLVDHLHVVASLLVTSDHDVASVRPPQGDALGEVLDPPCLPTGLEAVLSRVHGDVALPAVQGAELTLVAGLSGVALALDRCAHGLPPGRGPQLPMAPRSNIAEPLDSRIAASPSRDTSAG